MRVVTMMEMEHRIKMRYEFAMSSFARMYGVRAVSGSGHHVKFCKRWADTSVEEAPNGTLTEVDFYFRDLWDIWGEYI
ncbi:hypothetical protein Syn7803C17_201 [Synechococcus phage ACG-2014f]|uniref:Uncharacterized protein n=5 Tax=Atlauavirus TaxID=2733092 RepID=A0A0E3FSH7_9CAUD|nr:hypothetical protein HOQ62_gp205 [Synechococcus phage ACG-2014f_Syn7803C8]AIX20381.1 hypothetical protein Syn7803C80_204 [Synechococcus phage ACG-2014f]AIX21529.1 hypothetical protein Syn7803C8_205 [Synechococcus phage ACG-2014f_Syn7803C8]AIX23396.1 hypothetical protein Syn7803C9_206 [Synechococcus phage ACG-2014f]AIX29598.1 hypothetical protein Syn7803US30_202 [Synechococcus phage ACG-2014f]AIX31548.1 hypothetical protein Syn7803US40_204 [Synechococcus phage ACG-2014f]